MPVSTNTVSITGSSADFVVAAHNSGFGIFSSYSIYASQALSFGTPGQIDGAGSLNLTLDTQFGNLVFSGTDTVGVSNNDYSLTLSDSLSISIGSETFQLATGSLTDAGSGLAGLQHDLDVAYSAAVAIQTASNLVDTVAGSAIGDILSDAYTVIHASTVPGGTSMSHTASDHSSITVTKLS